MLCSKCQKDKPTPVTFKEKLYCLACASTTIDDEHEREIQAIQIRDKLVEANEELADIEKATAERQALVSQKEAAEKRIAEIDQEFPDAGDAKLAMLNQIDKLNADLRECEKED